MMDHHKSKLYFVPFHEKRQSREHLCISVPLDVKIAVNTVLLRG